MKFSIITPVWNCENCIAKTVRSVVEQKNVEFEHLLIDNCSVDKTVEVAKSANPDIVVFSEEDTGIYNAFNKGWRKATGDIIAFLNADDYYVSDSVLNDIEQSFLSDDSIDCVYGNIMVNDRDVKPVNKGVLSIDGSRLFHPSLFMKKKIFEELGGFNEEYKICADLDLFIRAKQEEFKFSYLDRPITNFALGGVSTTKLLTTTSEIIQILKANGFSRWFIIRFATFQYTKDVVNYLRH